jgi:hypothetical protein
MTEERKTELTKTIHNATFDEIIHWGLLRLISTDRNGADLFEMKLEDVVHLALLWLVSQEKKKEEGR